MHQRTVRTLRYLALAAGVAVLGAGTASAAEPVEVPNPATVCNNDVEAGGLLLEHPCFDGSQVPQVDVDEVPAPVPS